VKTILAVPCYSQLIRRWRMISSQNAGVSLSLKQPENSFMTGASTIRLNFADRKMNNRHTQAGHIFKAALFFFRVKPLKNGR